MSDTPKIYSICYALKINSNIEIMSPSLGFQERNNKSSVETNMFFVKNIFTVKYCVCCLINFDHQFDKLIKSSSSLSNSFCYYQ